LGAPFKGLDVEASGLMIAQRRERRNDKMKMNKRVLAGLIVIGILALMIGWGAYAYFSDTETSKGSTFQAGTIDLAVNDENPWDSAMFTFTDVKPCENLTEFKINITNVGNNPGVLTFSIDYVENDKYENPEPLDFEFREMEMTADEFASLVYVKAAYYQYNCTAEGYVGAVHDDLPNWMAMDLNGDGKVSIYEYKLCCPVHYDPADEPFKATASICYWITLHLGDSLEPFEAGGNILTGVLDNRPQADGIDITFSATLVQVP